MRLVVGATTLLMLSLFANGQANAAAEEAQGEALAKQYCIRCHATGKTDESNHPSVRPLREIAAAGPMPMLEAARKTGSIAGHDEMPEFDMELDQINALIAYLKSIAPYAKPPAKN